MHDYSRGVIYTIRCRYDTSLIYVGSTISYLSVRKAQHKYDCYNPNDGGYNRLLYRKIRETSWDDWYIELHEKYPCNDKQELLKKEGEVIRAIGTLNGNDTGIMLKDETKKWDKEYKKEYGKKYREQNQQRITCECGAVVCKIYITKHRKTQKHMKWEATQCAATN